MEMSSDSMESSDQYVALDDTTNNTARSNGQSTLDRRPSNPFTEQRDVGRPNRHKRRRFVDPYEEEKEQERYRFYTQIPDRRGRRLEPSIFGNEELNYGYHGNNSGDGVVGGYWNFVPPPPPPPSPPSPPRPSPPSPLPPNLSASSSYDALTSTEVRRLRALLAIADDDNDDRENVEDIARTDTVTTAESDYPEFGRSTHAWAIFADRPETKAGRWERMVGTLIIFFQLFSYHLFASEAVDDYREGLVPVLVTHQGCEAVDGDLSSDHNEEGDVSSSLTCVADRTDLSDALVAYFVLAVFLADDVLQAGRALRDAPLWTPKIFAGMAAVEVACAFFSAAVAVGYNLFIGEVTDAVEVGVGLLFVRDLSKRTYEGIRRGRRNKEGNSKFRNFFVVLTLLIATGLAMDPLCAKLLAGYVQ